MQNIIVVEDDGNVRELVVYALNNNGFSAIGFETGDELYKELKISLPDLIILDIMLPGDNGYELLAKIRTSSRTKEIPVILLTAKNSEYDKVKGLDMGADDYISKPFGVMELISRIKAILRRTNITKDDLISLGDISLNNSKRIVEVRNVEINLTFKEFELLFYLMDNKDIVLTRDKLINEVWGYDFEGESRTIDVHIRTLRQKLGDCGKLIQTVRNVGYKIGV